MAARAISKEELGLAVKEYAARHELTMSSNEKGFCLMPGDVVITLQDGKPSCSNAEILDSLIEILMDLAEEPARAPQKPNLPTRPMNTRSSGRYYRYAQIAFAQHVPPVLFICNIVPFAEADFATK